MQTIWKDIPGYENLYQIDINGNVKALKKEWKTGKNLLRKKDEHLLKYFIKCNGYKYVTLCKDGISKQQSIHYLLALTYIENPLNKKCINHIDGNKLNNQIINLEWATYKENNNHALKNKLRVMPTGKKNGYSVKVGVQINNSIYREFDTIKECAESLNISYDKAIYILNKKNSDIYKIERLQK